MDALARVRALIGDSTATEPQIIAALAVYGVAPTSTTTGWQIQWAAADLLETEAMALYRASAVTSVEDITINRGAVAKALLERAARLRETTDPDAGVVLVAEFHPDGVPWT